MGLTALEKHEKNRYLLQKRIVRAKDEIMAIDPATVAVMAVELHALSVKEFKEKLLALYEGTSQLCTDEEFEEHDSDSESLFNAVDTMTIKIMEIQKATAVKTASRVAPSFKLERIKMPEFNGNFHEWPAFRDLFSVSVDQNPTLSGAEKLIHLKTCLKGEAAKIVASFSTTHGSYAEAWASVIKRYNNDREIIFSILKRFDDHKSLQSESCTVLRTLTDVLNETVRSLKVLNVPVQHWDLILIFQGFKKLDSESRKQWSLDQTTDLPKLDEFVEFLEERARALYDSASPSSKSKPTGSSSEKKSSSTHHASNTGQEHTCPKCGENHRLFQCSAFSNCPMQERKKFVKENGLCFNCLAKGHEQSKCRSKYKCKTCKENHHSLLHSTPLVSPPNPQQPATTSHTTQEAVESVTISTHCSPEVTSQHIVLMGTLIATADDSKGEKQNCRVFVDPGSEAHFISEACVDRLGLKRKKSCISISGIGGSAGLTTKGAVQVRLYSKVRDFSLDLNALILTKLTSFLPRASCRDSWPHLEGLELADPAFHCPGPVDILLGAKAAASILLPGLVHGPAESPLAQNTVFGWMLSGEVKSMTSPPRKILFSHHAVCGPEEECVDRLLEKFRILEEPQPGDPSSFTQEDEECEVHYSSTHSRNPDGRYVVRLPFKVDSSPLGNSRDMALQRFSGIERRLNRQPDLKTAYVKAMRDSLVAGHMERVPPEALLKTPSQVYYMPHHVVVKESSSTTKHRIVFDASAKTSNGFSLNDVLLSRPKLQVDLLPLMVRFRTHLVAMSADIAKFYPQVLLNQDDVDFQRIVWREDSSLPISDYRMVRVTFGVTSAPFLAIRSLHQLAQDEGNAFPLVTSVLKEEFLVDNLLSGT